MPVVAHPSGILSNDATIAGTIVSGGTQININPYLIRVNTEEKIVINKGVFNCKIKLGDEEFLYKLG